MIKFSCYHTISGNITSAFCLLAEKCYHTLPKIITIVGSSELIPELDKALWTYAKIKYIPHATNTDPLPELQPIYITDKLENPNQGQAIIFINTTKQLLVDLILGERGIKINDFSRIMFLFDDEAEMQYLEIAELIEKSPIANSSSAIEVEYFKQEIKGNWQKMTKQLS